MTSSILAGEKRWASARRGGMTVLGKVAVPKPLNLPSQRLENHGLDPNVEIVPKGTLSWGSRASSSSSNAWGSSTLSPNADGGAGSPSHLSARPSSGGSGTRPSTAGSDRTNEPAISAWSSSSRPSSASGALSSNQTSSALLRPRSAETRPGSSQLSRFAEPSSDHSVAWGATDTAERLGVPSSKNEGFSMASGDFPTLGSERDGSGKTAESQDHGSHSRPGSASGRVVQSREKTAASHPDVKGDIAGAWKRCPQSAEDGPQPGMEKWQGEAHQYHGPNIPPQHFDAWRGPPVNPAGVWYRGPPGARPYGAPVPPGGFPIEPFPYFRPQIPPPALANSQPVPPGPGPRGHHPRGGDLYRPQIPDAYMRPGMPFRPGFYPGPMTFEGYYGPPMGYCNSNEREIPLMNMPPGPPVYNRYSGPNAPDPSNSHARAGGNGSNTKPFPDRVESAHPVGSKGPFKVLLKSDAREEGENWENSALANGPYPDRSHMGSLQKHEWGLAHNREAEFYSRTTTGTGNSYQCSDDNQGGHYSDNTTVNSFEGIDNMKAADDSWSKKSRFVDSSQPASASEKGSTLPNTAKDSTLMQKVESLNAKVRASDGCYETSYASEEKINKSQVNPKVNCLTNETGNNSISFEKNHKSIHTIAAPHITAENKGSQSTAAMSRRPYHGAQSRSDQSGKARFSSHDDGWKKKPIASEFSNVASATSVDPSNVHSCESGPGGEAVKHAVINIAGSDKKESLHELQDSADNQEQRAKMKELARQRALLLQKEEEERTREQKAKALAKLEELNRRMQSGDASSQKAEKALTTDVTEQGLEESSLPEPIVAVIKPQEQNSTFAARSDVVEVSDIEGNNLSIKFQVDAPKTVQSETVIPQAQGLLPKPGVHTASTARGKVASQSTDEGVVKHKRSGYKQRPYTVQNSSDQKSVPVSAFEISKDDNDAVINDIPSTVVATPEIVSNAKSIMANNVKLESSVQQKRRGSRTSKNKHKLDDAPSGPASPLPVQNDRNPAKVHTQDEKPSASQPVPDISSVQAQTGGGNGRQPSEQSSPLPTEEGHGHIINQGKPQHPHRVQRNQYPNRFADKFHGSDNAVWAPVRSQSKDEDAAEGSQKTVPHSAGPLKSNDVAQSNSKGKRAEIERYIPKPVAKELAQCGTPQPVLNSSSPPGPDRPNVRAESRSHNYGGPQPTDSATESVGFTVDSREGGGKHSNNRQGKAHGMWRQRGSTELALEPDKSTDRYLDQTRSLLPEGESKQFESKCSDELNTSDGWNMPDDSADLRTTSSVVKDVGTTVREKRYPSKGHRSTKNTGHARKNSGGETQRNHTSGAPVVNQMDSTTAARENHGMGNRTPHWQPKAHVLPIIDQQVSGSSGVQNVRVEADRPNKKDYHHHKVHVPPHHKNESSDVGLCQPVQAASEKNIVVDVLNVENRDPRRERKPASSKGHFYSPNQGPVGIDESATAGSAEDQPEQIFSPEFRRNRNQNNRVVRGQESRGDWSSGQDNRQQNISSSWGRQRNNTHYEYQPVGEYNNSKSKNFEGPSDGSRNAGPSYRERNQIQSKRAVGKVEPRVKTRYD